MDDSHSDSDPDPDLGLQEVDSNPREGIEQAAAYALELFTNTSGTRSHCLQLVVDGSHLQFWYYDVGGIICSEQMCWVTEFNKFAAIIVAFA